MTNDVTLTTARGDISVAFTNGILSTQFLAHTLPPGKDGPSLTALKSDIFDPTNDLRKKLAGDVLPMLRLLLERAKENGGACYCALYELTDPELLGLLEGNKQVHLILSNTGKDDSENHDSRVALHASGIDISDRDVSGLGNGDHIGHNKFVVYVDSDDIPKAVLTGSTNWTPNGLCAQSNNAMLIESEVVARRYRDYWDRLLADNAKQGPDLRTKNAEAAPPLDLDEGKTNVTIWYSPNTDLITKPSHNPASPPDLDEVFTIMAAAKQAIFFLIFLPGTPSIIDEALDMHKNSETLFIRGAVSSPLAMPSSDVQLVHRPGEPPVVVQASAIKDEFHSWEKELLSAGNAIIHDKIVVVDPLSDDCVVIMGSHNLGYKASYSNDENLLIIRGNRSLAEAYAVHVLDVYDHYRFRYLIQQQESKFAGFLQGDDQWQKPYFSGPQRAETKYWTQT
ncbi:MAG TPA: phospholipase D-like domain-containing protein [Thermoanaerobaculia bacterium]|nr:phospholipase D-like domain-containing protein [Thermoanaerobaculia bacterium]